MNDQLELPPLPRDGRCLTCSGDIVRTENPKPGVEWVEACAGCGKWYRWELRASHAATIGGQAHQGRSPIR